MGLTFQSTSLNRSQPYKKLKIKKFKRIEINPRNPFMLQAPPGTGTVMYSHSVKSDIT